MKKIVVSAAAALFALCVLTGPAHAKNYWEPNVQATNYWEEKTATP